MATPTNLPAAVAVGDLATASFINDLRGAFRILQVVTGTTSTQATFTSSTPATTGITATITPQSNTSKILVLASIGGCNKQTNDTGLDLWIYRNGSQLLKTGASICKNSTGNQENGHASALYLDNPATTSATTYAIFGASVANNIYAIAQHQSATSVIVLCEVSA
jgi:hypothetical protein